METRRDIKQRPLNHPIQEAKYVVKKTKTRSEHAAKEETQKVEKGEKQNAKEWIDIFNKKKKKKKKKKRKKRK